MLKKHLPQILNVGLRLASLAAKLALTIYMGRYFSLADLGVYGLVFGAVMTLGAFVGMKIDYIVARELVDARPVDVAHIMRDQAALYGLNYLLGIVLAGTLVFFPIEGIDNRILFFILTLTIAETFATMTYTNMNSLGQQVMANVLFFVRSGLWAIPVMVLGFLCPWMQTADTVLGAWLFGVLLCVMMTLWFWRDLPWGKLFSIPINWGWIRSSIKKCWLLWLGALGVTGGMYIDRFVVNHFLGMEKAGVATFYLSFTTALLTLAQSGVLFFAYPKLISLHRKKDIAGFRKEVRETFWHIGIFAGVLALVIGIGVPLLATFMHKQEFMDEILTLWLMLAGIWIRCNSETLYYVLFARHQDKPIWLGNILFLIPAFGCNALFVPIFGLSGIGYGTIIAASSLFLWRLWHVRRYEERAA